MKTIRVFGLPSHQTKDRTGGVDFVRIIQPLKHLDGFTYKGYKFKTDIYDILKQKTFNWPAVSEKYDVVFLNYTVLDWAYAAMAMFVHKKGRKIIMDLDDALWNINRDNIAHDALKNVGGGEILSAILRDVDGITTTNLYLKHLIAQTAKVNYDKMAVFPNAVDMKLYNHKSPAKENNNILLFHYGSTSHFEDLLEPNFVKGMDRIFKEYPNVEFKAIGAALPRLKMRWGPRYTYGWGHSDIYHWIKDKFPVFMDEADIMVVPLQSNTYNRCKSSIKWMETATATKPGVFIDIRPYTEHIVNGETGYLAKNADDWYKYLKILIDSKKERQRIGNNAYNEVKKNHLIQNRIEDYADFIIKILNS